MDKKDYLEKKIDSTFRNATLITLQMLSMANSMGIAYDFKEKWSEWRNWLLENYDVSPIN